MKERIISYINQMDKEDQIFLILYLHEELSLEEISHIMGKLPDRDISDIIMEVKNAV